MKHRIAEVVPGSLYLSSGISPQEADRRIGLRVINLARRTWGRSRRLTHFPISNSWAEPALLLQIAVQISDDIEAGRRVLVHCGYGINRSVVVAAISLVIMGRAKTLGEALRAVKRIRKQAKPDESLVEAAEMAIDLWRERR